MADEETKDGAPAAAPPQSWFDQFAAVAAARPGDLAVVEPVAGVSRTYDALLRRALRLAAGLEARGGGAGSPVAFYGARGADYCPAHAWTDGVGYGDMSQFYRTVVFMLLAGMSVAMQHDKVRSSTWNMLKAGAVPLFPVYLVGLAIETPIQLIPCESVTLAWVWWFLVLVMQGGWIVGFREGQLVMTHCWYLTSQIFFLVLFNWFQRSVKARPVGTPMDIARRAAAIQALVFPVRCVTIAMSFFIMHMWPPIQMGTFKIGCIG